MKLRNLLLTIRFDGAHFAGWQVQKNATAVMEVLQDAMEVVLKERPDVKGCSRTDSGVHALAFCVSFKTGNAIPADRVVIALNCNLPDSIVALDCVEVDEEFHARYSAVAKRYVYKVLNTPLRDPFYDKRSWHIADPIDVHLLDDEAKHFIGTYDFKAFSNTGSKIEDTVRTIHTFDVYREGDVVIFDVCGNGFLYNMVRILVGTLLNIGSGILPRGSIPSIIESRDRTRAGITVPPYGLYLKDVYYTLDFLGQEGQTRE